MDEDDPMRSLPERDGDAGADDNEELGVEKDEKVESSPHGLLLPHKCRLLFFEKC